MIRGAWFQNKLTYSHCRYVKRRNVGTFLSDHGEKRRGNVPTVLEVNGFQIFVGSFENHVHNALRIGRHPPRQIQVLDTTEQIVLMIQIDENA